MNKLIAILVLSSGLLATAADAPLTNSAATPTSTNASSPAAIAARNKCLNLVAKILNNNLKMCKDRTGPAFSNCKQNAYNAAKAERAACPLVKSKLR
jgi:hypothetical protein